MAATKEYQGGRAVDTHTHTHTYTHTYTHTHTHTTISADLADGSRRHAMCDEESARLQTVRVQNFRLTREILQQRLLALPVPLALDAPLVLPSLLSVFVAPALRCRGALLQSPQQRQPRRERGRAPTAIRLLLLLLLLLWIHLVLEWLAAAVAGVARLWWRHER